MKRDKDTERHRKNERDQERMIDKQVEILRPKKIRRQREVVNAGKGIDIQEQMQRQRVRKTEDSWFMGSLLKEVMSQEAKRSQDRERQSDRFDKERSRSKIGQVKNLIHIRNMED